MRKLREAGMAVGVHTKETMLQDGKGRLQRAQKRCRDLRNSIKNQLQKSYKIFKVDRKTMNMSEECLKQFRSGRNPFLHHLKSVRFTNRFLLLIV